MSQVETIEFARELSSPGFLYDDIFIMRFLSRSFAAERLHVLPYFVREYANMRIGPNDLSLCFVTITIDLTFE